MGLFNGIMKLLGLSNKQSIKAQVAAARSEVTYAPPTSRAVWGKSQMNFAQIYQARRHTRRAKAFKSGRVVRA